MKKVTLKSLTLVNFKGEKERTTQFNADVTTIQGGNGLGKTRHFVAFMWLLFGKDVQERKDYEVRSIENGETLHKVECSVTGVLDVDGEEITLKRSFVEDWVKPRRQVEQVFKGNHTECWWNETPVNVGEYTKRVEAIIDSSVFKMITNPAFFVNMPWKLQREQLLQLAGTVSDAEIAANNPEIGLLFDKLNGKSLVDFRKEIAFRKSALKKQLDEIKPRIDQTAKIKPSEENWDEMQAKIAAIEIEIAAIDKQIGDHAALVRSVYEREQGIQGKINGLKRRRLTLMFDAETKARQEAFEANTTRREIVSSVASKEREIAACERELKLSQNEIDNLNTRIVELNRQRESLLKLWHDKNGENFSDTPEAKSINADIASESGRTYQGESVCPHCGQAIPQDTQELARTSFESAKQARIKALEERRDQLTKKFKADKIAKLAEITGQGKHINETITEVNASITEAEKAREIARKRLDDAKAELEAIKTRLAAIPEIPETIVFENDVPGIADIDKEVAELQASLSTDTNADESGATDELKSKKDELNRQRDDLNARLARRDEITRCDNEIADLEKKGKELAQQIVDIEKEEYTIRQFTKIKIEECEKRINSMFTHVSFRLFDYTIEGKQMDDPNETCIPLVNGVPYGSANTAGQVNAGLDIINVLCKFYGICAPIFIDNRESVNELIPTLSQIINLVVTRDNALIIK